MQFDSVNINNKMQPVRIWPIKRMSADVSPVLAVIANQFLPKTSGDRTSGRIANARLHRFIKQE